MFFRHDVAAGLAGHRNRADLIGLVARARRRSDDRRRARPLRLDTQGLRVLTGAKRGEAESPEDALSREDIVAGLTVFALLAAFVAVFVVASTFALSVQQRHRELALFRAIGSTPRQVRRMIAGEALLVSLAAVVARRAARHRSPRGSSRACSRARACCPWASTSSSAGSRSPPDSSPRSSRPSSRRSRAHAARHGSGRPTRCARPRPAPPGLAARGLAGSGRPRRRIAVCSRLGRRPRGQRPGGSDGLDARGGAPRAAPGAGRSPG